MTNDSTTKPRVTLCSSVSEAAGEDPAGSSWFLKRIMLVELPLPWPENVLQARHTPEGLEDLMWEVYRNVEDPWGLIGFAPDSAYSVDGMTRIFDLQQLEGVASTYHRDTYLVPAADTVRVLRLLTYEPEHPDLAAARRPDDQATRDFFICTHGSVDACCATQGHPMYQLMRAMADTSSDPVRVWRCTHFGGHRFAATALEAPDGRYWGRLQAQMLSGLVHRRAGTRDLRPHYRGWAALPEPLWQIAEAEILAEAGWSWADVTVTSVTGEATAEDGGRLTFAFTHPNGRDGVVEVEVTPAGTITTMNHTKSGEYSETPQYRTRIVRQEPDGCLDSLATS